MLHQHCKSCCLTPLNVFIHPQLTLGPFPMLDLLILLWLFPVNILRKLCEQFKLLWRRRGRQSTRQSVWLVFGLTSGLNCECNGLVVLQSSIYFLADLHQWFGLFLPLWFEFMVVCLVLVLWTVVDVSWAALMSDHFLHIQMTGNYQRRSDSFTPAGLRSTGVVFTQVILSPVQCLLYTDVGSVRTERSRRFYNNQPNESHTD